MKRRELIRHLRANGCIFIREGSDHSWWGHPVANKRSAVHRHTEINKFLARKIFDIIEEMRELVAEEVTTDV